MVFHCKTTRQHGPIYPRGDRKLPEEGFLLGVRMGVKSLTTLLLSRILRPIIMPTPEQSPKIEKTSFFVRGAVKCVPIDEFLRLRYQYGVTCDSSEYKQITDAEVVVQTLANKKKETYSVADYIPRSSGARVIVTRISLQKYLAARHEVLEAAIAGTIRQRDECESLPDYGKELEKANERLTNRLADLNLTNKVIAAAKISLSSAV